MRSPFMTWLRSDSLTRDTWLCAFHRARDAEQTVHAFAGLVMCSSDPAGTMERLCSGRGSIVGACIREEKRAGAMVKRLLRAMGW